MATPLQIDQCCRHTYQICLPSSIIVSLRGHLLLFFSSLYSFIACLSACGLEYRVGGLRILGRRPYRRGGVVRRLETSAGDAGQRTRPRGWRVAGGVRPWRGSPLRQIWRFPFLLLPLSSSRWFAAAGSGDGEPWWCTLGPGETLADLAGPAAASPMSAAFLMKAQLRAQSTHPDPRPGENLQSSSDLAAAALFAS